jgi:hypothetical protein
MGFPVVLATKKKYAGHENNLFAGIVVLPIEISIRDCAEEGSSARYQNTK